MLNRISIGWRWLENTLNGIIDAVNQQKPLGSASVAVEESPNGSLLRVVGSQQGTGSGAAGAPGAPGGGGPTGGQWCTLSVIDTSTGTCVTKTLTYWGTPPQ
jgi:hypothetical protein